MSKTFYLIEWLLDKKNKIPCLTFCDHKALTRHNLFYLRNGCRLDKLINEYCGKNINLDKIMHPEK